MAKLTIDFKLKVVERSACELMSEYENRINRMGERGWLLASSTCEYEDNPAYSRKVLMVATVLYRRGNDILKK